MDMFLSYTWPGNVRELENNIKRYIILGNESQLISEFSRKRGNGNGRLLDDPASPGAESVPMASAPAWPLPTRDPGSSADRQPASQVPQNATLKEVSKIAQRNAERELIEKVLVQTRWNRRKAALILDISYKALLYKIKECGLDEG
jgi:two-component system response regulator AtoC